MSLKAKNCERVQSKMGKIDIDYQNLHDAFFKFQTKPPLTGFGEVYYEGKEFETSLKAKRPGDHSPELVEALSIPPLAPPPWLISMRRFGPPPTCHSAQWNSHPGGWGKPPLDAYNRPLYGDVFCALPETSDTARKKKPRKLPPDGMQTPSGLATPSGMASVVLTAGAGLETPGFLELRKTTTAPVRDESGNRKTILRVSEETNKRAGAYGGISGVSVSTPGGARDQGTPKPFVQRKACGVDVSLDASELEGLSEEELRRRYDEQSRGSAGVPGQGPGREDFSEMVAKEMAKKRLGVCLEYSSAVGVLFTYRVVSLSSD
ncbi:hypothetical protein EI94DRAFT_1747903 [Lactarius quietus]|nr:hypothetical protein EI94DRAFT_1763526 [Lactarius quietus]KAF8260611.1 hypothetical protein EI94DRAFT_1747903 [Lactarius quietus]